MTDRERTDAGTFAERVTLDAVREVFDRVRGPVVTSSDVADALECTTEAARQKLTRLYDRGEVDKRKTGRTVVYWPTDDGDAERGREAAVTPPEKPADRSGPVVTDPREDGQESALDDALSRWEPDTETDARTARSQTRRVAEYLRTHGGRWTRSRLVDALAGDSTLGERSWWERAVRPGLQYLAEEGLVEYRSGNHDYRWVGGDADA
jgi:hypothetical protein